MFIIRSKQMNKVLLENSVCFQTKD